MTAAIEGTAELARKLSRIADGVPVESGRALVPEAKAYEQQSRSRTPVDTGDLRDSHETSDPKRRGDTVLVEITAGGPRAPYGPKVHEDVEASHATGRSKFMESVILEGRSTLLRKLAGRFDLRRLAR